MNIEKKLKLPKGTLSKEKTLRIKILDFISSIGMILFAFLIVGLLLGIIVSSLWNWLMPTIFGLVKITWLQGAGLIIMFNTLFFIKGK